VYLARRSPGERNARVRGSIVRFIRYGTVLYVGVTLRYIISLKRFVASMDGWMDGFRFLPFISYPK
jgi:hypothetical protein